MKFVIEITRANDIYGSVMLASICHIWQIYVDEDLAHKGIKNPTSPGYIHNVMALVTVV